MGIVLGLGKRMGLDMSLDNGPIDMEKKPSKLDLLKIITKGPRVPIVEIAARDGGNIYDVEDVILQPADPETQGKLDLYPSGLSQECAAASADLLVAGKPGGNGDYTYLLISRRMKNTYNSTGPELSLLKSKGTTNPAFIHPGDLEALGITDGEQIKVPIVAGLFAETSCRQGDYQRYKSRSRQILSTLQENSP